MLTLRVRRWTSGVVAAVTVAGAAFALVIGVRSTVGDQDMKSALIASSQGRDGRALALADKAVSLAPDNIVIRLAAAEIDGDSETLAGVDRGLSELSAGLSISPSDPVLGQESGALLVARAELTNSPADWRRCLAALTLLVRSDPLNPTERLQLGVAEDNVGSFGQAASQWRLAAYLAPRSAAPDADLAILYEQEGRSAAARQAATDALRIDGTDQAAQLVLDQERQ
jgi:tetratricopeptide (TPR) repeat protein